MAVWVLHCHTLQCAHTGCPSPPPICLYANDMQIASFACLSLSMGERGGRGNTFPTVAPNYPQPRAPPRAERGAGSPPGPGTTAEQCHKMAAGKGGRGAPTSAPRHPPGPLPSNPAPDFVLKQPIRGAAPFPPPALLHPSFPLHPSIRPSPPPPRRGRAVSMRGGFLISDRSCWGGGGKPPSIPPRGPDAGPAAATRALPGAPRARGGAGGGLSPPVRPLRIGEGEIAVCVDAGVGPYSYPEAEGGTHGWDEIWRHLCSFSFLLSFIFLTATKKKKKLIKPRSPSFHPPPKQACPHPDVPQCCDFQTCARSECCAVIWGAPNGER